MTDKKIFLVKPKEWMGNETDYAHLEFESFDKVELSSEELRQIKISIKTRIEWAKDMEESSEFQSNIDFMEALLKKLETVTE